MNPRIQKLYEQSWVEGSYQEPIQGELGDEQRYRTVKTYNFDHEHFAKLIVRECATLAYDGPNGILEHFGVEE